MSDDFIQNELRQQHADFMRRGLELKSENAQLREAANHFRDCRECAEDGLCWLGRQHDDFLRSLNGK